MRNDISPLAVALAIFAAHCGAGTEPPPVEREPIAREIYIPFEELAVVLEQQPQRIMLSRAEYEDLLRKARQTSPELSPSAALLLSADYDVVIAAERAELTGRLVVEVLRPGLQVVDLPLTGAGLRHATLDGKAAPIGRADDGTLRLFVEGIGQHALSLDLVAPLETTAALQTLQFQGPPAAARRMHVRVPGSVEVKSGASVLRRSFDPAAQLTELDLLLPGVSTGQTSAAPLVMTLNNRLLQQQRVVFARDVLVTELTTAFERVHATFSFSVLHRPIDTLRFALPDGFEVTDVRSPLVSQWAVDAAQSPRVLNVRLREATGGTVVLGVSALRTRADHDNANGPAKVASWALPELRPLDVVGEASVIGILIEDRLKLQALHSEGLFPIDAAVLDACLPPTVPSEASGAPALRAVAAFFAPTGPASGALKADFIRPTAGLQVSTTVLVTLAEQDLQLRAGVAPRPEVDKIFSIDISVPALWHVTGVTDSGNRPLRFEMIRNEAKADQGTFARVYLPGGVGPGEQPQLWLNATCTPTGWLGEWTETTVAFPAVAVRGATSETGALAVQPGTDLQVFPDRLEQLAPLDDKDVTRYGLAGSAATTGLLAYRFDNTAYSATFRVQRNQPRRAARTYSFLRLTPGLLTAHYELVYDVQGARTRRLAFFLPASAPTDVTVTALGDVSIKEHETAQVGDQRRWNVLLAAPQRGTLRLAIDFQQPLGDVDQLDAPLPIVRADHVVYQSGIVAVEGSAELSTTIVPAGAAAGASLPRRVDVGELAGAEYRLTGATAGGLDVFQFVGETPSLQAHIARRSPFYLPPAIVQLAEFTTLISPGGVSQTAARLLIRTKADFLELELPDKSELWSAEVDGQPCQPQREGTRLLLSLPARSAEAAPNGNPNESAHPNEPGAQATGPVPALPAPQSADTPRELRIVYATLTDSVGFWGSVDIAGLRLRVPTEDPQSASAEIPVADVSWYLDVPVTYQVMGQGGTVSTTGVLTPEPAAWTVARTLYRLAGGVNIFYGGVLRSLSSARVQAKRSAAHMRSLESPGSAPPPASADMPAPECAPEEMRDQLNALGYVNAPAAGAIEVAKEEDRSETTSTYGAPMEAGGRVARKFLWSLEGVRSLKIELTQSEQRTTFQSLGGAPRLHVELANTPRVEALRWSLALAVALAGMALSTRRRRTRASYVAAVVLVATLIPLIFARPELSQVTNAAFYVAVALVPCYLLLGAVRSVHARWRPRPAVVATALVVLCIAPGARGATGAPPDDKSQSVVVRFEEPPPPVKVPEDAIIVPYEPQTATPAARPRTLGDQLLVPYRQFVELWNRAYPSQAISVTPVPAAYALAGAEYIATLGDADHLTLQGQIVIDVYVEELVSVPIALAGGAALAQVTLDGQPARLGALPTAPPASENQRQPAGQGGDVAAARPSAPTLTLQVKGKRRHRLDLTAQLALERAGGWRVANARLPAAPATALTLHVTQPDTDVRLGSVQDRHSYDGRKVGDTIVTALGPDGALELQWRPRVQEGAVEASLTADSNAVLDVREDGLYLTWALTLDFGRTERDQCALVVPADYLVHKVQGANVRGWLAREPEAGAPAAETRLIDVSLLKAARGAERLVVVLHRLHTPANWEKTTFAMPLVGALGAALHRGQLTIRRSPWIDLQTQETAGVTRSDAPADLEQLASQAGGGPASPLGIRVYQSYRFAATPFALRMTAARRVRQAEADLQLMVRVSERQRTLEARVQVRPGGMPTYQVRVALPADFKVEDVAAPGPFEWSVAQDGDRPVLAVYLAVGQAENLAVVLRGTLGVTGPTETVALPVLEVLDVRRQSGEIVVQVDPAFDVRTEDLRECREIPLREAFDWVREDQRPWARFALKVQNAQYAGVLRLTTRTAQVTCATITNVRVTGTTIEETILLDYSVAHAGIRSVSFLLPAWLKDARITVPMLREKHVTPASADPDAPVRVSLTLQGELMGSLRVLVQHDRVLTAELQRAPLPVVETGETSSRSITLENAGRDEVVVETLTGVEALVRGQKAWDALARVLGTSLTQAYVAGNADAVLAYRIKERTAVETAGARIGLSEAVLVVDAQGTYRATQSYRVDNTTEQFLEVQMPAGAELWTVNVAGQPVKPARNPDPAQPGRVRVPLIKTAAGDLDFLVTLHYGGRMSMSGLPSKVAFPFVRTVNVPVELSQVQLYLPEDFTWFDFGGTTRQITDQGDLFAGRLGYQTRQTERLLEAMRGPSRFAQLRASTNTLAIQSEAERSQRVGGQFMGNASLTRELARNDEVTRRAATQAQQIDQGEPGAAADRDNRAKLEACFDAQSSTGARNVVSGLEGNFAVTDQAARAGQQEFDQSWLSVSQLGQPTAAKEKPAGGTEVSNRKAGKGGKGEAKAPAASPKSSGKGAAADGVDKLMPPQSPPPRERGQVAAGDEVEQRYKQQLRQQVQGPPQGQVQATTSPVIGGGMIGGGSIGGGPFAQQGLASAPRDALTVMDALGVQQAEALGAVPAAAGLVSLNVDMPIRGRAYYFTTPRGDVTVTARSLSQSSIGMMEHAGVVLAALLLAGAVYRLAQRPQRGWRDATTASTLLIVLGLASVATGVLPVLGLIALLSGLVLKVLRRRTRLAPAQP